MSDDTDPMLFPYPDIKTIPEDIRIGSMLIRVVLSIGTAINRIQKNLYLINRTSPSELRDMQMTALSKEIIKMHDDIAILIDVIHEDQNKKYPNG